MKSPTSSFFLAVDGDRRLAPLLEGACLLIDGGELGVTIRVVRALFRCAGALQTVVERVQQVRHGLMADLVSLTYQLGRQLAGALAGPAQGRHGVSTGGGFHQRLQVVDQGRILRGQRLASAAWGTHPLHAIGRRGGFGPGGVPWIGLEFADARANGDALQAGGVGDRRDPTTPQHHRLGRCPQPTPSLIQIGS